MIPLTATRKAAEKALPKDPAADVKIIDADVSTELNFKKFKVTKIDGKPAMNQKCIDAGECSAQDYEDVTEDYLIADGAYTLAKAD